MAWTWRYEGRDGEVYDTLTGDLPAAPGIAPEPAFQTRSDAESWLGENWRALRDAGVVRALLLDGAVRVGRPVSLEVPDRRSH